MSKPYIQFYIGDWRRDPGVTRSHPATRGIWFDLICAMADDETDHVEGTPESLARLGRCSEAQFADALADMQRNRVADITTHPDGTIRIVCRRMQKQLSISSKRASAAKQRFSKTDANTHAKPEQSSDICSLISELGVKCEEGGWQSRFVEWIGYRLTMFRAPKCAKTLFREQFQWLQQFSVADREEILGASMRNGWQGLFEPKCKTDAKHHANSRANQQQNSDRNEGTANAGKASQYRLPKSP